MPARTGPAGAEPPAAWPAAGEPQSRHGAISRRLYTYSTYKVWADKMRASWVEETAGSDAADD
ncbi:MAG: hypothetical protein MUC71_14195 [Steroidobacteraceae bacterium]|nr:hypothetical protein [Steroidobacteraceae bacterium]